MMVEVNMLGLRFNYIAKLKKKNICKIEYWIKL